MHPNNPDANWVVDQIETTLDQRPDYVAEPDFDGPVPELPSPGPVFDGPVDALPSPEFKTFDPLTNPAHAMGGDDFQPHDFAYQNHFGSDSAFVASTFDFDMLRMTIDDYVLE